MGQSRRHRPGVERPGLAGPGEYAHASLAFDPILPLIDVRVPVEFAHGVRLNLHQRRGDLVGSREYARICDARRATLGFDRRLGQQVVAVALRWAVAPAMRSVASGPRTAAAKMYGSLGSGV